MELALFNNISYEILKELEKAQFHIRVAVAWFTNHRLLQELCKCIGRGIKVDLIIIDDFINNGNWGLDFQHFINLGGNLFYGAPEHPMHHKFCVIDNSVLFNGSYNWTYFADNVNVENTVMFQNNPILIQKFIDEFEVLKCELSRQDYAIKRQMSELDNFNYYSVRNYTGKDLYYRGKQSNDFSYLEAASRILPYDAEINDEYLNLSNKKIQRATITGFGISAYINENDNQFSIIIPNKTTIPFSASNQYVTKYGNQTSIQIHIYQGEELILDLNKLIGSFTMTNIPPKPAGQVGIEVTFSIDQTGILMVKAKTLNITSPIETIYDINIENMIY